MLLIIFSIYRLISQMMIGLSRLFKNQALTEKAPLNEFIGVSGNLIIDHNQIDGCFINDY